jgi:hypothetical protein
MQRASFRASRNAAGSGTGSSQSIELQPAAALDLENDRITTLERRLSKQRLHVPAAYRMLERRIHAARNPG